MWIGELGFLADAMQDAQRLTLSCVSCVEFYHYCVVNWKLAGGMAAGIAFMLAMIFFSQHSNLAIATPMVPVGQWVRCGRWSPLRWYFERRERAMHEKDLLGETSEELISELVDYIESQRDSTLWTDIQCDIAYSKLKKSFPIFRYAIDNPKAVREVFTAEISRLRLARKQRRAAATEPAIVTRVRKTAKA